MQFAPLFTPPKPKDFFERKTDIKTTLLGFKGGHFFNENIFEI